MTVFVVLAVGLLLTATLIGIAPVIGWFDRREGLEYRKPIEENIPVVGGAAILGAVAAGALVDPTLHLPWPALITAFLLAPARRRSGSLASPRTSAGRSGLPRDGAGAANTKRSVTADASVVRDS